MAESNLVWIEFDCYTIQQLISLIFWSHNRRLNFRCETKEGGWFFTTAVNDNNLDREKIIDEAVLLKNIYNV